MAAKKSGLKHYYVHTKRWQINLHILIVTTLQNKVAFWKPKAKKRHIMYFICKYHKRMTNGSILIVTLQIKIVSENQKTKKAQI